MLKFKYSTTGNQNSLRFIRWQVHGMFPLCFNSSLNFCRYLHSFNFIGSLFHKTLRLKSNESIPYFWVFSFGIKRKIPLLSEYRIFFSLCVFPITFRSSLFSDLYISMSRNSNDFDESSVYYPVKSLTYVAM